MKRLIIDGKEVFEIDEECLKRRNVPQDCDIEKYHIKNYGCQTMDNDRENKYRD